MDDPFRSSLSSIEYAKGRITEFEVQLRAFFDTNPYVALVEPNADRTKDLYKIKLVKPIPFVLPHIAFNIINTLRSALDHAGYACAIGSGIPDNGRIKAAFPFRDDPREFNGARTGTSKHIPKEIFNLMLSFKPYKGGDDLLWALNKLCNTNKHEALVPHVLTLGNMHVKKLTFSGPGALAIPRWDSRKHEMVWLTTPHGSAADMNVDFTGFITFKDIKGMPVVPADVAMGKFASITDTIIAAIRAEYLRLGFSVPS